MPGARSAEGGCHTDCGPSTSSSRLPYRERPTLRNHYAAELGRMPVSCSSGMFRSLRIRIRTPTRGGSAMQKLYFSTTGNERSAAFEARSTRTHGNCSITLSDNADRTAAAAAAAAARLRGRTACWRKRMYLTLVGDSGATSHCLADICGTLVPL